MGKPSGKPSARNGHAGFDVAGAGNRLTVRLVRHSQRKRGATDRPNLRSMAPVLDPTERRTEASAQARLLRPSGEEGPVNGSGAKGTAGRWTARRDSSVFPYPVPSGCAGSGFGSLWAEPKALIWKRAHGDDRRPRRLVRRVSRRFLRGVGDGRSSLLSQVTPPTGEPDAGNPPVRFGGKGEPNSIGSPYSYHSGYHYSA